MLSYNFQNVQKFYLGELEVSKFFLGNSEIFSSIQGDPYINNVSLLLHMDGLSGSQIFIDNSTNNFVLTGYGNVQIDTNIKKFGSGSVYFDGSGDYISGPINSAFSFPDDFTIELWNYPTNQGTQGIINTIPLGGSAITPNQARGIQLNLTQNNRYSFAVAGDFSVLTSASATLNQWNHVALVRSNNTLILFVNGKQQIGYSTSALITAGGLNIGISVTNNSLIYDTYVAPFSGYMDEIRITKGIARYTSNFVPQTAPFPNPIPPVDSLMDNLVAYWSFDASSIADDKLNYTAVINGGSANFESGKYNTSLTLTQGKRLRVSQNLWNVKTNPLSYSVSFWVKPNQLANTGQETVLMGSCFGDMGFFINLGNTAPQNFSDIFNQHVHFWLATGTGYQYKHVQVPFVTTTGVWYHIAATYDLPNQTAKLYVNGNLIGTETNVLNNNCTNSGWTGFCLNGSPVGTTSSEYGNNYTFDMVGIWTRTLTDSEVSLLYTNYAEANDFIV